MFSSLRRSVERSLRTYISEMGEKSRLRDAVEYALMSGGKRLRPLMVHLIAEGLGHGLDVSDAALSVEFFHTASLIADDLPCMDDDDMRRNAPSLHVAFGETTALLASYTLIASGYEGLYRNGRKMKADRQFADRADEATVLALEIATRCAGIQGATNGQFLDLFPPDQTEQTIRKVIEQKTVTLFQISFVFGWVFGGGATERLKEVENAAYALGMAFQIADDLQDDAQDSEQEKKVNIASVLGTEVALAAFDMEMERFIAGIKDLGLWNRDFRKVVDLLKGLIPSVRS
jgi:geranylgeranyl diphosphate synthase type II